MSAILTGLPAALVAGLAVAVALGPPAVHPLRRLTARSRAMRGLRARLPLVLGSVGLATIQTFFGWRALGWVLAGGIIVGLVVWLARQSRAARRQQRAREEVAAAAHTLALLLRAGQIPTRALAEAAADNPCLAPAAATVGLGGDVGEALLVASREPGREALVKLAGAWRVSEASGAPVAKVVGQVTETVRRERQLADVVATELAAARTSGRIMATLPFLAIALGMVAGADPISFLFGEGPGQVLLVAGVALAALGVVWTERIASGPGSGRQGA